MSKEELMLLLTLALFITCAIMCFSLIIYLRKYHVISTAFAKFRGKSDLYNKNKQEQLKLKLEQEQFSSKIKFSLLDNIFLTVKRLGILRHLPGFNELQVLLAYITILTLIWLLIWLERGLLLATGIVVVLIIVVKMITGFIIYEKKEKLEAQLSSFVNACEGSATVYSDIIDIFGDVYDKMRQPLRGFLEECYLEAKKTNDKKKAIQHLKEKSDSLQFKSVIDNLELCSEITGNYRKVINDIRGPIRIYQSYKNKKRAIVRNGRVNILVMCTVGLFILYACTQFIDGLREMLIGTTPGIVLLSIMGVTLIAGLTIRIKD